MNRRTLTRAVARSRAAASRRSSRHAQCRGPVTGTHIESEDGRLATLHGDQGLKRGDVIEIDAELWTVTGLEYAR